MMKHPGVAWFDGVSRDGVGTWLLDVWSADRGGHEQRQVPLLESVGMDMASIDRWSLMRTETFFEETSIFLGHGQRLMDANPIVRKLWPNLQVSGRHAVFRFDVQEQIYLVPALFLIGRLFLSVRSVAKYLLQPGMFESFVDPAPVVGNGEVHIRLPAHILRIPAQAGHGFQRNLDSDSNGSWTAIPRQAGQLEAVA